MFIFDPRLLAVPGFVIILLLARLVTALWPKRITRSKPALPGYGWQIIYTDNASAKEERKPDVVSGTMLRDPRNDLQGKPDFIYSNGSGLIPVELKSGRAGDEPREGDLMQLAAYFFLAESEYGIRPREGRLIYSDCMFTVRNTRRLRNELMDKLNEIRSMMDGQPPEVEPSYIKCRHCPCRGTVCETDG